jgi:membrane-associated PAP2 superfamily phosphatase
MTNPEEPLDRTDLDLTDLDLDLTDEEHDLLTRCYDDTITHRRIRSVIVAASIFAVLLAGIGFFTDMQVAVTVIALIYVMVTTLEKVAFGRAVLLYKSLVRKLAAAQVAEPAP